MSREFLSDDLTRLDAPREQFFETVKLTALEPLHLPFDVTDSSFLRIDTRILHQLGFESTASFRQALCALQ